jgi:hypothetical protein
VKEIFKCPVELVVSRGENLSTQIIGADIRYLAVLQEPVEKTEAKRSDG